MTPASRLRLILLFAGASILGCDHGFQPPDAPRTGTIRVAVTYVGEWPDQADVHDLRFVAMRFVPRDTADFLQLNRMAISGRLSYGLAAEIVEVPDVETGAFVYSGIAQQFRSDLLAWKPLGLFTDDNGIFQVEEQDTTDISLVVDFDDPPVFPPL